MNNPNLNIERSARGQAKEVQALPTQLSGETVLPGFVLQVDQFTD
jgi:hypothetical protein